MEQENDQDRIQRDAADIAVAATDIERQRSTELAADGEEAKIDAELAELARRRAEQEHAKAAAHDAIVVDEKRIADADRDLKEVLGSGGAAGGSGGYGGNPSGDGNGGMRGGEGGPGPKNPPVVPPRRVG